MLLFIVTMLWIIGFLFAFIRDSGGDYTSSRLVCIPKKARAGESAEHSRTTHSRSIPRNVKGCDRLPFLCSFEGLWWSIKVENW